MDDPSNQTQSYIKRISAKISGLICRFKMGEHSFILTVAVLIGMLGGFAAVGIQYAIHGFENLFWGGDFNLETILNIHWAWKIFIPTMGGVFVGLIIQFVAREAKGHGVPEVMEAISLRNGIIRPRVVIAKLMASAVYIASGGSVGREGPVIQIGSAIGSSIGQIFKVNPKRMRTFVACGAASGIAAAFNAPVAGALFAVEVILGDFAVPQFSPVVISSVMATVVWPAASFSHRNAVSLASDAASPGSPVRGCSIPARSGPWPAPGSGPPPWARGTTCPPADPVSRRLWAPATGGPRRRRPRGQRRRPAPRQTSRAD